MPVFFREHATTSPLLIMSVTPTLASMTGSPFSRARAMTVLYWSFERDPYDGINRYCAPLRTGIRAMSGFQRSLQKGIRFGQMGWGMPDFSLLAC